MPNSSNCGSLSRNPAGLTKRLPNTQTAQRAQIGFRRFRMIQKDFRRTQKESTSSTVLHLPKILRSKRTKSTSLIATLPLKAFVAKAGLISIDASECSDTWKSPTWEFVRLCRTHPKLMSLTADQAFNKIPWSATGFEDEEQLTFIAEWDRVRSLPGMSPLHWAANLARQHPLLSTRKHLQTFNEFVSLAGWLQVSVGVNNPIFSPTRKVAEILSLKSNATVRRYVKWQSRTNSWSSLNGQPNIGPQGIGSELSFMRFSRTTARSKQTMKRKELNKCLNSENS